MLEIVPFDSLASVAAFGEELQASKNGHVDVGRKKSSDTGRFSHRLVVDRFLDAKGIAFQVKLSGELMIYKIRCPFHEEHGGRGEASVMQGARGALSFKCMHDSCAGLKWEDFRDKVGAPAPDHFDPPKTSALTADSKNATTPVMYERVTCAELASGVYDLEYLIDEILVARQPCVFAGSKKTLKTSLLIALALSLASGQQFIGRFAVRRLARTLMMTGESGLATIQETAVRIAAAQGIDLEAVDNLIFSPSLPIFGSDPHMDALREMLAADRIEILIVDPAYLSMPTDGHEGSLFAMGALLRSMTTLCQEMGVTFILAHHTRKNLADPYAMPELEDVAWAGFTEFARQWLLVGRRERYEPGSGNHQLWLNVGGSAGHSSCWALGINEGHFSPGTPRRWEVTIETAQSSRKESEKRRQAERDEKRKANVAAQIEADKKTIVQAMVKMPDGGTKTDIRDRISINPPRFRAAWASLVEDGVLAETKIQKGNNRSYAGWKLNGDGHE